MKSNNKFYDKTKKHTNIESIQYYKDYQKKKRFKKLIIIDVVLAMLGLVIFALFHHAIPKAYITPPVAIAAPENLAKEDARELDAEIIKPEQLIAESIIVEELPLDETEPMLNNVFADKFTDGEVISTDISYQSKNINLSIEKVATDDITYYVADIYIRDITNFQTALAKDQYGKSISDSIQNIAASNNALLALTGDYYGARSEGIVIRNSNLYRDVLWRDVLIMYLDGSMETFSKEEFNIDDAILKGAYQGWSFGPMLLKDGKPMTEFDSGVQVKNPRSSIGYYEPGHYVFVTVDGRGQSGSSGMTMQELSQLYYELGCKVAYNLDGGGSAKMMFDGDMVNNPSSRSRQISDILMIVETEGQE